MLKTLMHHMKAELHRIERLHTLKRDYSELKQSQENWLEKTPDLTPLKTLRSSIKTLKSQLRHRLADKADFEESEDSGNEELSKVLEDLDHIREQLHSAFDKEDTLLTALYNVVEHHFPELSVRHPELGIDTALQYRGMVKLGRSLEQYHTFSLDGSTKNRVVRAKYGQKDVVLKEYIIEETMGLCKEDFLTEALKYATVKSPNVVALDGIFFLKSERHAYVQLPYYKQCVGNLGEAEIRHLTPSARYQIIKGVLSGLKAVHDEGLVHGAVHPNNVFINDEKEGVLADFYFSSKGRRSSRPQFTTKGLVFSAPECCPSGQSCSKEADMYCLGLLIVFLYRSHADGAEQQQPFGQMDPNMQGFVQNLLQEQPMERYSSTELMNESYFKSIPVLLERTESKDTTLQLRAKSPSQPSKDKTTTVAARLGIQNTPTEQEPTNNSQSPAPNDLKESDHLAAELTNDGHVSETVSHETYQNGDINAPENPEAISSDPPSPVEEKAEVKETFDSVEQEQSPRNGGEEVEDKLGESLHGGNAVEQVGDGTAETEEELQKSGSHEGGFSDMPGLEPDTSGHEDTFPQQVDILPEDVEEDF